MRQLSMVLRKSGENPTDRMANIAASVDKAKEAVALDVTDAASWSVLRCDSL